MFESTLICPYCKNQAYFDSKTTTSYCKTKLCQGVVLECGKISYENEVNQYETDDHTKKQNRFGGYENKQEAFKNKLCEMLEKNDSKSRKKIYQKFDNGEHKIQKLSSAFMMDESFRDEAIKLYRSLIFQHALEMKNKSFRALAVISFCLMLQERKNRLNERNSNLIDRTKIQKITPDDIIKYSNVTERQLKQVENVVNFKAQNLNQAGIIEQIIQTIYNQHKLPFSEGELRAAREISQKLFDNAIIRGEKTSTIICVVELMICQLSSNLNLNKKNLEEFTSLNDVSKDTAKKFWNKVVNNKFLHYQIPEWEGKKSNSELKHLK